MMTAELPSASVLNECFTYDPISGLIFWKERPRSHFNDDRAWRTFNSKYSGSEAGYRQTDKSSRPTAVVVKFRIKQQLVQTGVHRIVYGLMGVTIPPGMDVDHADLNPYNNSWNNLRIATHSQNLANRNVKKARAITHAGLPKGVYRVGGRFMGQLKHGGKTHYLGLYDTPEDANAAYLASAQEVFGEFARG